MKLPSSIKNLIDEFTKLPTVGPKTAERFVFYLLRQDPESLQKFAQAIAELKEKVVICQSCFSYAESSPCEICSDSKRDSSKLCIVSETKNKAAIEKTNQYNGYYFVLGGEINFIEGVKPENLNIAKLIDRIKRDSIKEIILALNPTLEGETTAMHLTKLLKPTGIKITKLARGLSTGIDLEYADDITIANALKYRNEL